jgi:hypothetical protein
MRRDLLYLFKELSEAKTDHSLGRSIVRSARIARDVKAWNSKTTTSSSNADHILENNVRLFLITTVAHSLITDSINRSINLSVIGLDYHIHGIALGEVNGSAADLLGGLKTFGNAVDDEYS